MGPNSDKPGLLEGLVDAGMDVARFNFSHGDHAEHKLRMDRLKAIREEKKIPVAILLDTGLASLPGEYFSWLAAITLAYMLLATMMKKLYIKRYGELL